MRALPSLGLGVLLTLPVLQPAGRSGAIAVGDVVLTAGMAQDRVLAALSSHYTMKPTEAGGSDSGNSLLVLDGKTLIANVVFRSGRLMLVNKYWDPADQQKGAELARKFYGAIGSLVRDGYKTCVIDTGSSEGPQAEIRTAFIICGPRSLEVSVLRADQGESAMLVEKLR